MSTLTHSQMKYWLNQFIAQFSGWTLNEKIQALEYILRSLKEQRDKDPK